METRITKPTPLIINAVLHVFELVLCFIFAVLSFESIDYLLGIVFILWLFNIIYSLIAVNKRQTFLFFNITFFVFLLGRLFVNVIFGVIPLSSYTSGVRLSVYIGLSLALVFTYFGQLIGERINRKRSNSYSRFLLNNHSNRASFYLLLLFYLTFFFNFLYVSEKAFYVVNTSYLSLYISYSSSLPYLFIKIGELNQIAFIMLFCFEYKREKLLIPLILYLTTATISLATGQRNAFVLNLIVVFTLVLFVNKKSKRETGKYFLSPKLLVWTVLICLPLAIVLLEFVGNYRSSNSQTSLSIANSFGNFLSEQGGQIEFFADTFEYKNQIWSQTVPYTFSSVYNYIRNLFGLINFGTYTEENALFGNNLGATQFYITSPTSLTSGRGAGCCYLSELYFDFGFFGIIVGSILIGFVLSHLVISQSNSFVKNAFIVLMIRHIIYIPRASYFDWISYPFNVWNITFAIGIVLLVNTIKKQQCLKIQS